MPAGIPSEHHRRRTCRLANDLAGSCGSDRGELDPDAPVARYWPEFAASGQSEIPVRWIMAHQSGLAGLVGALTVEDYYDWQKITELLAAQPPLFPPGTTSGYQAMTFGYLIGEVIRRIAGQSVGRFFATEIADPLDADFHIGLPEPELGRCSELQGVRPMVVGDQRAHDGVAVLDVAPAGWRE